MTDDLSTLRTQAAATALARKQTADSLFEQAGEIDIVETDEDADRVGRLLRRAKGLMDDSNEERMGYTRLLDNTKSAIIAEYKPVLGTLEDTIQHTKGLLDEQRRKEQARLDEEAAEREAAVLRALERGDTQAVDAALEEQLASPARDKAYMPAGTSVTRHIKVEVVDKQRLFDMVALGKLPLDLFDVNMTALRALGRTMGDTIPGAKVEWVEGVGASAR